MAEETNTVPVVGHWIDGKPDDSASVRLVDVFDPATGKVTKHVALASSDDVDRAVSSATDAFGTWRHSSLAQRTRILFSFRELYRQAGRRDRRDHHV